MDICGTNTWELPTNSDHTPLTAIIDTTQLALDKPIENSKEDTNPKPEKIQGPITTTQRKKCQKICKQAEGNSMTRLSDRILQAITRHKLEPITQQERDD